MGLNEYSVCDIYNVGLKKTNIEQLNCSFEQFDVTCAASLVGQIGYSFYN